MMMDDLLFFDPTFPCAYCEEPVLQLSVGGSAVCPWCDMGHNRDGTRWDMETHDKRWANFRRRLGESHELSKSGLH